MSHSGPPHSGTYTILHGTVRGSGAPCAAHTGPARDRARDRGAGASGAAARTPPLRAQRHRPAQEGAGPRARHAPAQGSAHARAARADGETGRTRTRTRTLYAHAHKRPTVGRSAVPSSPQGRSKAQPSTSARCAAAPHAAGSAQRAEAEAASSGLPAPQAEPYAHAGPLSAVPVRSPPSLPANTAWPGPRNRAHTRVAPPTPPSPAPSPAPSPTLPPLCPALISPPNLTFPLLHPARHALSASSTLPHHPRTPSLASRQSPCHPIRGAAGPRPSQVALADAGAAAWSRGGGEEGGGGGALLDSDGEVSAPTKWSPAISAMTWQHGCPRPGLDADSESPPGRLTRPPVPGPCPPPTLADSACLLCIPGGVSVQLRHGKRLRLT